MMTDRRCKTCRYWSNPVNETPCRECKFGTGLSDNWKPNDPCSTDDDASAREERLQAQVDTYRQALSELMGNYQKNGIITRVIWYRCKRLLDGSEPMPARSDAQVDAYQHALGDLMMQCEKLRLENEALKAKDEQLKEIRRSIIKTARSWSEWAERRDNMSDWVGRG